MSSSSPHRLPRTLLPSLYRLRLRPDLDKLTFAGSVSVDLKVASEGVDVVVLNALDVDVEAVSIRDQEGAEIAVKSYSLDKKAERLQLELGRTLEEGSQVTLQVDYAGKLNDQMRGFYRSVQKGPQGETNAASCHFEAASARMAFPCWDEPTFRAAFEVTLEVPDDGDMVALSNMPEKGRERLPGGLVRVSFDRTPSMPTYLVCWSVGRYDHVGATSRGGVPVRVFTPVGKRDLGRMALAVASRALDYYAHFFGVDYALPKMDLIAIPDFAIGAMENWGLLTFRESCLLADEKTSSGDDKQFVALVVAHEVAHQWFGNLVTVEWWTHLWLKEGYATWIEFLCVDHVYPEWGIWTQFLVKSTSPAKSLDALRSSHPIEVEVGPVADVEEIFDTISYEKGANVIRMLFGWIGEDAFRKGMNHYLKRLSFGNARTEDLWESLGQASGKPVAEVMAGWTRQKGFPLVKVRREGDQVTVSQEVFSAGGKEAVAEAGGRSSSSDEPTLKHLLRGESDTLSLGDVGKDDWVNFNPKGVGFYRVSYPKDQLSLFFPAIRDRSLPVDDRLTLLNDQLALTQAGMFSTPDLLVLMECYKNEDSFAVWDCLELCMSKVRILIRSDEETLNLFNKWCSSLLCPSMDRLGWEPKQGESHLDSLFRSLVVDNLVRCGHPETLEAASGRFTKLESAATPGEESGVTADLRTAVYRARLKKEGEAALEKIMEMARKSDSTEEKLRMYDSLGSVSGRNLLQRALEFSVSDGVRSQDASKVIRGVSSGSSAGADLAWRFFRSRLDEFRRRYRQGPLMLRAVAAAATGFADDGAADEIEKFFADNPTPGVGKTVSQIVEATRLRAAWAKRDSGKLLDFLRSKNSES